VGTIDACILPGGTAYVSDIGMVGPIDSVIGDNPDSAIERFLTQMPSRLSVGKGKVHFDAILVEVDENTGKAVDIKRIQKIAD
jgi:calcineurin-like phosphoesterase